jgi:hypothetical protein
MKHLTEVYMGILVDLSAVASRKCVITKCREIMMMDYIYTAWFRDPSADPADQDYEWPACILIKSEKMDDARQWGDVIARRRSQRQPPAIFLHSTIEEGVGGDYAESLPVISFGEEPTDSEIGW